MFDFFRKLFDTSDFPPRWHCGKWDPSLGWLHIISDTLIFAAYFTIPLVLAYFTWKRKDIPFQKVIVLFGLFILACGLGHLIEASIFWTPWYRLSGLSKAITAIVSLATVVALIKIIPHALTLPGIIDSQKKIIESTPNAILLLDPNGKIEKTNDFANRLFISNTEEMEKLNLSELIHQSFQNEIHKELERFKNNNAITTSLLTPVMLAKKTNNRYFPVTIHIRRITLGDEYKLIVSLTDVTELEKSKSDLEKTIKELKYKNEELDKHAYIASHDLRSPLRAIQNLSGWIEEDLKDKLTEETRDYLSQIKKRTDRMDTYLNDLLNYSKISKNKEIAEEFTLTEIQERLLNLLNAPSEFDLEIKSDLNKVLIQKTPFFQVLLNLTQNAIKHHPQNKPIKINIDIVSEDEFYVIEVTDNGDGIEEKYHNVIFEMFKTLKSRDTVEGSGMGLAYVKRIVELYEGFVEVKSKLGHGSTFKLKWKIPKLEQCLKTVQYS